jgi:ribosome-binding factor A
MPFSESVRVIKILEKQVPSIQTKLNSMVKIKFVPRIKFYPDMSEEKANRVEEILKIITK